MFDGIYRLFSYDLGVDLGTANTLILVRNQGITIREPSVIAINKKDSSVVAVGKEAAAMFGKTPPDVLAIKPLSEGVIADFEATIKMLDHYIRKVHEENNLASLIGPRPKVIVGIPSQVTEVERRAVAKAAIQSGARQCMLVDEPMAAAIGAGMKISSAQGNLIVDIGGGTTEIALISLGGIVTGTSLKKAGRTMDQNIADYAQKKCHLVVGQSVAEQAKIEAGAAIAGHQERGHKLSYSIRGREVTSGLPRAVELDSDQIAEAIQPTLKAIISGIVNVLEEAPPELVSDVQREGLLLAGGSSQLRSLDKLLKNRLGIKVAIAKDPQTCVVRGCGHLLENDKLLKRISRQ